MKQHLTSDQINEWLVSGGTAEIEKHVKECPDCKARISKVEGSLAIFRESMQLAGENAAPVWNFQREAARAPWAFPLRAIVVAMALLVLAIVPAYRPEPKVIAVAKNEVSDAALLRAVEQELGEAEPHPMQPLAKLVSYNTSERSK